MLFSRWNNHPDILKAFKDVESLEPITKKCDIKQIRDILLTHLVIEAPIRKRPFQTLLIGDVLDSEITAAGSCIRVSGIHKTSFDNKTTMSISNKAFKLLKNFVAKIIFPLSPDLSLNDLRNKHVFFNVSTGLPFGGKDLENSSAICSIISRTTQK